MLHFLLSLTIVVTLFAIRSQAQTTGLPSPPPPVKEYNAEDWKEFTSGEGGFTVSIPGIPTSSSESVDTEVGQIVMHLYVLTTKLGEYGVSYSDFPVRSGDPTLTRKVLDGSRDELLANGAKLLNENEVTVDGILGRELILERDRMIGRQWMFLVNGRLYAVILATKPDVAFNSGKPTSNPGDRASLYEATCKKFFGSFKFTKREAAASSPEQTLAAKDALLAPVTVKTNLYPETADAKKEIDEALKQAVTEKKRVLLVFGGNWCYDCHVLDRALHEGEAGKVMKDSFLLVHVDIGEADKNLDLVKKYKTTLDKGVPVVVMLGSDGRLLYGSNEGEFEAARSMMKKDLVAFLLKWKERRPASRH